MADIQNLLQQLLTAIYGKDVRQAIVDAIKQCYNDASEGLVPVVNTRAVDNGVQVTITVGVTSKSFIIKDGYTPIRGTDYWTEEDIAVINEKMQTLVIEESAKRGQLKPEFANSIDECMDTSKLYVLPDGYIYAYTYGETVISGCKNYVPLAIGEDGEIYNGVGYKDEYRLNSNVEETEDNGYSILGFIPVIGGDVIRVGGGKFSNSSLKNNIKVLFYKRLSDLYSVKTEVQIRDGETTSVADFEVNTYDGSSGITMTIKESSIRYVRFVVESSGADAIVTVNEEIKEDTVVKEYRWVNTKHFFTPADYEERIIGLEENVNKQSEVIAEQAKKIDMLNAGGYPDYVISESEKVAEKILAVRSAHDFVFGAVSDMHTTGLDSSAKGVLHAGMALDKINSVTQLDLVALFGDVMSYKFDDTYKAGFLHVKKSFADVAKAVPYIQMQGNHDELSTDTTEEAEQKYFAYIGANNINTVTDWENRHRNYGYRDFESQKMRVIYLNSVDVSAEELTGDCYITSDQMSWFVNKALDFTDKADADKWAFIVCNHHPLNWGAGNMANLLTILDGYKGNTEGTVTIDGTPIVYDFTKHKAEFIAHFHGHLHNFRTETFGNNKILSITIPNACFNRNNEYGMYSGYTEDVHEKYGDTDADGIQRQFNKTADCTEDTAFNVVVVNRANKKIYCFNYGAGIDREISY